MNESERIASSVIQKRQERCRHFNGIQHKECEAGVNYEELEKSGALPCKFWISTRNKPLATCGKYAVFTPEELAQQEREMKDHLERFEKVMESITPIRLQVKNTRQSFAGIIDCAGCGGKQTLTLRIASYNGHAHGKCRACDIAWME